ncbi:family 10 glycosylhydrolase [Paenibacillus chitinolyticus]|uniref:family 10 glycosylhydrolase n=1 Tax=Paenibacillus chitinolyticus TaxID=79263 RepID=UPI002DC002C5|nr:family 10 glycosylhydrolase [Paenibacillus chitinolyticus]MEC0245547.1 family 10 glycosylhydrolase [Paenibacillus chitinolyticus]
MERTFRRYRPTLSFSMVIALLIGLFPSFSASAYFASTSLSASSVTSVTYGTYNSISLTPNPVTVAPTSLQQFAVSAYDATGNTVPLQAGDVSWSADSAIGTVDGNGLLTAAPVSGGFKAGYVTASYGGLRTQALVMVGSKATALLEDFETINNGKALLSAGTAGAAGTKSSIGLAERPEPVLYGSRSLKFAYDMRGTAGTSAAFVSLRNPDTGALDRPIEGTPKKIGVWVYGDESSHWLRARLRNQAGVSFTVDFTSSTGFNWKGWRYVTAEIPSSQPGPFKFMDLYLVETKDTNKNAGVLYYDRLSAIYSDTEITGLDLTGLTPMKTGQSKTAEVYMTKANSTSPQKVENGVSFYSSNPDVAVVDGSGRVSALKAGKAVIAALYSDSQPAAFELDVTDDEPQVLSIQAFAPDQLEAGRTGTPKVFAAYANRADSLEVTKEAQFASSNPSVAEISVDGKIVAKSPGSASVTVTFADRQAVIPVTVIEPVPVLTKIQLTDVKSMNIGAVRQAKVLATYTLLDVPQPPAAATSGVTYKSSSPAVAEIDAAGAITAKSVGVTTISASLNGKTDTYSLVVNKETGAPKHEMRAAWIATVENIDWPVKGTYDAEQQKRQLIHLLDELEATGINTVIYQVRPTSDAFYRSALNPWSAWLTGTQGKDPGYDPLAFAIQEAHKRNMELHAWFNPYRISNDTDKSKLADTNPAVRHPDWVVSYGGKLGYNPGKPEVKRYIIDSIMEVVNNYDIDAVHFDDYFYPYPVTGVDYPDAAEYAAYGSGMSLADWRRSNVDSLIRQLSAEIKKSKSYVQFGISPFGIWRNKANDPAGSETNGLESYSAIYADSKKWVDEQWIDYITPQLYWNINYSPAAYDKLIDWWKRQVEGKHVLLYAGHGVHKIGADDPNWLDPDQLPNQILFNRNFADVKGSMFFSAVQVLENKLGFQDRLKTDLYKYPSLMPEMGWLSKSIPAAPAVTAAAEGSAIKLNIQNKAGSTAGTYVIYRSVGTGAPDTSDPAHIWKQVKAGPSGVQTVVDNTVKTGTTYTYVVTALERGSSLESPGTTLAATAQSSTGSDGSGSGGTGSVGGPGPTDPSVPAPAPGDRVQVIERADLKETDGSFTVTVPDGIREVHLPADTGTTIGNSRPLLLRFGNVSVSIPNPVVQQWQDLTADTGAKLVFKAEPVEGSQLQALVQAAENKLGAEIRPRGMYDFRMEVQAGGKTAAAMDRFSTPLEISFQSAGGSDINHVALYHLAGDGTLQYIADQKPTGSGTIMASIRHFSTYGLLEVTKSFQDVNAGHWAYPAISELSRKLIVTGVTEDHFSPQRQVTRAEFAALLVRALGLPQKSVTPFSDVKAGDWFAEEVAAAFDAGIVTGMTDTLFEPGGAVTREQMAAMLIRAYEAKHGKLSAESPSVSFTDAGSIREWAKGDVAKASAAGLLNGREGNLFAPQAVLTRAESAQAVYNLLK